MQGGLTQRVADVADHRRQGPRVVAEVAHALAHDCAGRAVPDRRPHRQGPEPQYHRP